MRMRLCMTLGMTLVAGLLAGIGTAARAAPAEEKAAVTVCDNLVTLRKLMAQEIAHQDPDNPAPEPDRTGCSEIKPDRIGDVQRRTVIGGAPFECRSIDGGACQWVEP